MSAILVLMTSVRVALVDTALLRAAAEPGAADPVIDSAHVTSPPGSPDAAAAVGDFLDRHADDSLTAVGYRLVHGGTRVRAATLVDDEVIGAVREVADLAPLHVPPCWRCWRGFSRGSRRPRPSCARTPRSTAGCRLRPRPTRYRPPGATSTS
jgi:hypothetical protein